MSKCHLNKKQMLSWLVMGSWLALVFWLQADQHQALTLQTSLCISVK